MDATTADSGSVLFRLQRTWLNTNAAGDPYWPTAADYLSDLPAQSSDYQRKARRRQRPGFYEVWQLRRLLSCLDEVEAGRERLSTEDQTAFDDSAARLKDAFGELAKAEHLNPELLLSHVRKRLSPEWTRWLSVNVGSLQQQLYVAILEDARDFTVKARSKQRLTPKEADRLRVAADRIGYFELKLSREDDETPVLGESCEYAHGRILRVVKLLSLRFGVSDDSTPDAFWHGINRRATEPEDTMREGKASTAPSPSSGYTIAAVLDMTGVSGTTLNQYAKMAGVKTPQRGKRNHRYTAEEVRAILHTIIDNTSDRDMKSRCLDALDRL